MAAAEIREHTIDDTATVFFFARAYEDDRASAAAYDRARAKISGSRQHERVSRPDPRRRPPAAVRAVRYACQRQACRVAWGGEDYSPTADEITAIGARLREVAQANALDSTASWSGVGGLALGPTGSRGPMRRPRG